jgi:hypothetical protein
MPFFYFFIKAIIRLIYGEILMNERSEKAEKGKWVEKKVEEYRGN